MMYFLDFDELNLLCEIEGYHGHYVAIYSNFVSISELIFYPGSFHI